VILAAGMKGIEEGYDLPPEAAATSSFHPRNAELGIGAPTSLDVALGEMDDPHS
jgi:hypothetical protein